MEATAVLLDDGWHGIDPKKTQLKGSQAEDLVIFSELYQKATPILLACRLMDVKAVRKVD